MVTNMRGDKYVNSVILKVIKLFLIIHIFNNAFRSTFGQSDGAYDCELSITTVNKKRVCRNQLIFEDDFNSFDESKWTKEQYIPSYDTTDDDMVFNYFLEDNVEIKSRVLEITPKIVPDSTVRGRLKLDRCTGTVPDECEKQAKFSWILPPVSSGRVTTKNSFSFKYGHVEITAKVPRGDWLMPEAWLVPKNPTYGPGLESGKICMFLIRGNHELESSNGTDLSNKVLESNLLMSSGGKLRVRTLRIKNDEPWNVIYNKYLFTWRPDEITISVNGIKMGTLVHRNLDGTLGTLVGFSHEDSRKWLRGSAIAPFDEEFFLSLGLSVGGRDFPDGSVSSGYSKPWRSKSVKEMLNFWQAKDKWAPSWKSNLPIFKILRVKVRAL